MKTFDNLAAMRACLPEGACEPTAQAVADMEDYFEGPMDQASFTDLFGEPLYLVEQVEDLGRVMTVEMEAGRRLSLAEAASGSFDVAEWVDAGRFARFVMVENADGGPQYLMPRGIADQVSHVATSIEMTVRG